MQDQYRNTTPEEFRPAVPLEHKPLLDYRRVQLSANRTVSLKQHEMDRFTILIGGGEATLIIYLTRADVEAMSELLLRATEDLAPAAPALQPLTGNEPAPVGVPSHSSIYGKRV